MALTRFLFATSMLLLTFLVIASASDYGSAPKPKVDDHDTPKPPKVDDHDTPKLPKVDDHDTPKPPKVDDHDTPKLPKVEKPKPQEVYAKQLPHIIGIQGLVLCKSGLKSFPIKGAVARITCLGEDEYGYETAPFSILSGATDAKGYFFATLSPSELQDKWKLTECKAFLDYSPFQYCQVPTDVNHGITGHLLASYRILNTKKIKLYSVGPFFFTSETEPKSTPNNGY